jgi:hypothetical protein
VSNPSETRVGVIGCCGWSSTGYVPPTRRHRPASWGAFAINSSAMAATFVVEIVFGTCAPSGTGHQRPSNWSPAAPITCDGENIQRLDMRYQRNGSSD